MHANYIEYENFDINNLIDHYQKKNIPNNGGPLQTYEELKLLYNFNTKDEPCFSECIIKGCEMKSVNGIIKYDNCEMIVADINNKEFIRFFNNLEL